MSKRNSVPLVCLLTLLSFTILAMGIMQALANEPPVADPDGPYSGTEGVAISFDGSGSSDSDGTIDSYLWDFGDEETSNERDPTHIYAQDGTYTVTLTVTDNASAAHTDTTTAIVDDIDPIADFSATPTSGVEPLTVSFTDASTSYDGIVSWMWDFGDGGTSNNPNPAHTYNEDGTYTVTLTVNEADGDSDVKTKTDYITASDTEPLADFTASPTSGPEPLTVSFTDTSTSYDGIVSWSWSFGDGETSTERNPIHTYVSQGQYTVSLTVSEADGSHDTITKFPYIIVEDSIPTASFTYSPSPLEDSPVTFDASDSTGYDQPLSYDWDFGDSTYGEGVSPTHTYSQNGEYLVTLTVTDSNGDNDSTSLTIAVTDKDPASDFTASPTDGFEPLQVRFEDKSDSYDGITGWTWNFGDGQSSGQRHPTHVYSASGAYTVSLTITEADGDDAVETKTAYITVVDTSPTADFTVTPSSEALTLNFADTSTSYDEIVSWTWDFGDGGTSTEQSPTHKFSDDGLFDVTLTVTDADDSTDTIMKRVSVTNTGPTADFNIVSSEKPTINEDINFIDQSIDPDGYIASWFWDLGDGTTLTTQNVVHKYQALGTYIVTLTVTDDDGSTDTVPKSITIFDVVPPLTTHNYDGSWRTSDYTITLTATDDLTGIAETYYRINDGPIKTDSSDGQPYITSEGSDNKLEYWSVDNAGNEELPHNILTSIKLDKTNPTAAAGPDSAVDEDSPATLDGSASFDNIGISSYSWTFFDQNLQTLAGLQPTYTFNTPGEYTITLTVTDAALNSGTDTLTIIVQDITKPVANAGDDQVVHEDTVVTLDASSSTDNVGIVDYIWTFREVAPHTLFGINTYYTFNVPGSYNVTLTVSDARGNSATDIAMITVVDATYPLADAGTDQLIDEDTMVIFDGSASYDNVGISSYVWTFRDGTPQTLFGVNPTYTFETPGLYTVTLNVTDAEGHFTTDTVVVTVRDITRPVANAGNYASVVEKIPVNFDASNSFDNSAIVDYQWDFGDGTYENSTIPSTVHIYTSPGAYIVTLTVVDDAGNTDENSISVIVYRDTDGDLIPDYLDEDNDNDGIPDDWEILHGLNPLDPSDALLDFDGDSLTNLTEYQIGSDPNVYTSPSPFPVFIIVVIAIIGLIITLAIFFMRKL